MFNRRQFLQTAAGAAGVAGIAGLHAAGLLSSAAAAAEVAPAERPLKILFLGGTGFIGPHQIEYALARGHEVTMFNRGRKAGMYGGRVEEIVGNRDTKIDAGLKPLEGDREWDVIVDNSGYIPRHVRDSVELLKDRCGRYIYVSTVAAYDKSTPGRFAEDGPIDGMDDTSIEEVTWETYGPLKGDCDRFVREALGSKATVVRPTFIVGPGDTSDRFTWWVDRIHRGGDIVGPPNGELDVQTVDVRDLCPWIITLAENDTPGAFNAAGQTFTREGLLWAVMATTGVEVNFHWPSAELVEELEMPTPMLAWGTASNSFANEASRTAGMEYRPVSDSALGTLEWWKAQSDERRKKARGWPTSELEAKMLARMKG